MKTYLLGLSAQDNLDDDLKPSEAAYNSINKTLETSGITISEVDFLISATSTPDFNNPGLAPTILGKYEGINTGGIEIRQSAAGFHYALDLAKNFIEAEIHKTVIIVCTEFLKRAYTSKNQAADSELVREMEDLSGNAVFSCLVTSENLPGFESALSPKFLVKDGAVYSNEKGFKALITEIPSSSQLPERITVENIKQNRHLPAFRRNDFAEISHRLTEPALRKFNVNNANFKIRHSPCECEKNSYYGSAGVGEALTTLLESGKIKAGETVSTFSCGAGLNWGVYNLELV